MTTRDSRRPDVIGALLRASTYPHRVGRIELLETHISWVLLTGRFAYKIKKPIALGFLDFRTLEKRRYYCEEELRLNRAWAPRLYLDVVPITKTGAGIRVGGEGTPVEFAVRMRQFEQIMRLDHQIETGRLRHDDLLGLAEEIARRHFDARRITSGPELLATTRRLIWDNFDELQAKVPDVFLGRLRNWMQDQLAEHENEMLQRCGDGHFRECHGDLHLGNIVRLREGIRAFDCIEFSRELREIDIVADYAFLTMDFVTRGATDKASVFVNRYLEKTGDYDGARLLPLYLVYRAMVRAKVAVIASGESKRQTLGRYCALARAITAQRRPILVQSTGFSGSGKTWLSTRLLSALPAVRLRSDLERKRLFGLEEAADSRSGIAAGIYDREADVAVYDRLLALAGGLLRAGLNVILDASFLAARQRERVRQTALASGASAVTVQTVASEPVLRKRLQQRQNGDVSEANVDVLVYQLETADTLSTDELADTLIVDTEADVDVAAVVARIRQLAGNS